MIRVISFKIWGDFAHFRRHYTTSSPLTHSLPPPSALRGVVAAILGLSRDKYPEILAPEKAKFGIRLLRPLKKIRLGINLLDTKDGNWIKLNLKTLLPNVKQGRLHTQVRTEFIKDPAFEVFFHHSDAGLMDNLKNRLKNHAPVYTPYLGITECIANFEFMWDAIVPPSNGISKVISAFKMNSLKEIKLTEGLGMVKEKVPVFINKERLRELSEEIVFSPQAQAITAEIDGSFIYPNEDQAFAFIG